MYAVRVRNGTGAIVEHGYLTEANNENELIKYFADKFKQNGWGGNYNIFFEKTSYGNINPETDTLINVLSFTI